MEIIMRLNFVPFSKSDLLNDKLNYLRVTLLAVSCYPMLSAKLI